MSIKINFMYYMKWIKVILTVVFEEFKVVCIFLAIFFFSLQLSIGKRSTLAKIWGAAAPPSPPGFYGPVSTIDFKSLESIYYVLWNVMLAKYLALFLLCCFPFLK